ncbi:MAG: NADH-quinone oxidoreductase subunit NuoE [Phycisphaerae bacterium]
MTSKKTDNWQEVKDESQSVLPDDIAEYIQTCRGKGDEAESYLISVLHKVQAKFGYLSEEHLDAVAQLMQIPAAKVSGVATFYHFFRLTPKGKYMISICLGTACYVKGAEAVARQFKAELGVEYGETTGDGMFTLEATRCLGTCGIAPVIMINEKIHGQLTPDDVPKLIREYRDKAKKAGASPS